tara:strand:- start:328 stop:507 length:180 start_codon:yes stop_codon:yes gene_type:complete
VANRDFLIATVNPWYEVVKEAETAKVVITEITSSVKKETNLEFMSEHETLEALRGSVSL